MARVKQNFKVSMAFTPPGYRLTKICKNCAYYKQLDSAKLNAWYGYCFLEREVNPTADARPTHGMCVCDAHVYKNVERNINRLSAKYGVSIPDETAL